MVSCAVTLGLCVWTAIHPDVSSGKKTSQRVRHKMWMAVQALFVPEIVVSIAWEQWREARTLHRAMVYEGWRKRVNARRLMENEDGEKGQVGHLEVAERPSSWVKNAWNELLFQMGFGIDVDAFPKEVAFFVAMGGFVRRGSDGKNIPVTAIQFFHAFKEGTIDTADRIKARALKAEAGINGKVKDTTRVPTTEINLNDIEDKGKTSVLAKTIICGQVGWLVLQLLGRRIAGLTMPLIELHTLIHILIAALTYWFWWHKPLDVHEPIVIDMKVPGRMEPVWHRRPAHFETVGIFRRFFEHLWLLPLLNIGIIELPESERTPNAYDYRQDVTDINQAARTRRVESLWETDDGPSGYSETIEVEAVMVTRAAVEVGVSTHNLDRSLDAESGKPTKTRKKLLQVPHFPKFKKKSKKTAAGDKEKPSTESKEEPSIKSTRVSVNDEEDERIETIIQENLFACVFYFIYAALHATAWNTYFSSWAEMWIWRGACLVVGVAPLIILGLLLLFKSIQRLPHNKKALEDAKKHLDWIIYGIYLVASIGLLLEALVSLRRLPAEVYDSVPWTAYIPHF